MQVCVCVCVACAMCTCMPVLFSFDILRNRCFLSVFSFPLFCLPFSSSFSYLAVVDVFVVALHVSMIGLDYEQMQFSFKTARKYRFYVFVPSSSSSSSSPQLLLLLLLFFSSSPSSADSIFILCYTFPFSGPLLFIAGVCISRCRVYTYVHISFSLTLTHS